MHARLGIKASYEVSVRSLAGLGDRVASGVLTGWYLRTHERISFPRRVAPVAVTLTSCSFPMSYPFGIMTPTRMTRNKHRGLRTALTDDPAPHKSTPMLGVHATQPSTNLFFAIYPVRSGGLIANVRP